jgi:hypothetical protein
MGLAGEQNLEAADFFGDGYEAGGVVEEQAGALIGCDATCKAKGEDVRVEDLAGAGLDFSEEAELALAMGGRYVRWRDAVDRAEVLIVGAPGGDLVASSSCWKGSESQVAAWTPLVMAWMG